MGVVTQIIDLDNSSTIKNEECRMIRCGGNDNVGAASYSMCFGCLLEQVSVANASKDLICNDLCQPPKVDNQAKTNYSVSGKHPDRVMISDPGIGHSDIRGFGFLLTDRSMVRRERHRLLAWITVSCANSDPFVDRSNLDKTITLSRCFPWLCTANLVWIDALTKHFLSSFPR